MRQIIIVLLLGFSAALSAAENSRTQFNLPQLGNWQVTDPVGAWPFVGASLGYMDHNSSVRTEGAPTNVKLMGSYYFENRKLVADLGFGLNNHFVSQSGQGSNDIFSTSLEVAARYRMAHGWQAGPVWTTLMGTDRYHSVNDRFTSFIGAEVIKEMPLKDRYILRIGGRAVTDTDVKGENVNMFLAQASLGFIPQRTGDNVLASERRPLRAVASRGIPLAYDPGPVRVAMFELSSAEIDSNDRRRLDKVAKALLASPGLVESVVVIGHADPSGPDTLNNRLAKTRADNVAGQLRLSGIRAQSLQVVSKGATEPVTQSFELDELAKSRRVELRFMGVKDQAKLAGLLNDLL